MRSHLPLVRAMARRYARGPEDFDDLVQAGSVGLLTASRRFDPERAEAFATFVAPAVEAEMRRHLHDRRIGVRLPRENHRMTSELERIRGELAASLGRPPDARELAAALDADLPEVEQLITADLARHLVALGADDSAVELHVDGEPPTESEYRALLAEGLRALDDDERRIVFLRFHADMTESQIARTVGISQARVSQLREDAFTKLTAELTRGESASAGRGNSRSGSATGYSGRILVRMPSELHEQLALAAEREEVSLNRYVNEVLSNSIEPAAPPHASSNSAAGSDTPSSDVAGPDADGPGPRSERLPARGLRLALATNLAVLVIAAAVAVVLLVLALERGI